MTLSYEKGGGFSSRVLFRPLSSLRFWPPTRLVPSSTRRVLPASISFEASHQLVQWRNEGGTQVPWRRQRRLDRSRFDRGNRLLPHVPFDMARDLHDRVIDPKRSVPIMLFYGQFQHVPSELYPTLVVEKTLPRID